MRAQSQTESQALRGTALLKAGPPQKDTLVAGCPTQGTVDVDGTDSDD